METGIQNYSLGMVQSFCIISLILCAYKLSACAALNYFDTRLVNLFELIFILRCRSRGVSALVLCIIMQTTDRADEIDYNPFYKALQVGYKTTNNQTILMFGTG